MHVLLRNKNNELQFFSTGYDVEIFHNIEDAKRQVEELNHQLEKNTEKDHQWKIKKVFNSY